MKSQEKTTAELVEDLSALKQRIHELEQSESEFQKTEQALRSSEARFRELAELLPETVFESDMQGTLIFANKNAFDRFGYTRNDFEGGLSFLDMVVPHDRDRVLENMQSIIKGEKIGSSEYVVKRKDGSIFPTMIHSSVITRDGQPVGFRGFVIDITERKQAEEALRIHNLTFSEVLNSLDALVYVADMKTYEIVFINAYGKKIWGDIKGKICWQVLQKGKNSVCEFCTNSQLIGTDGKPNEGVAWEFQNMITKRWYDCRDKAIYWPDGCIVRMDGDSGPNRPPIPIQIGHSFRFKSATCSDPNRPGIPGQIGHPYDG